MWYHITTGTRFYPHLELLVFIYQETVKQGLTNTCFLLKIRLPQEQTLSGMGGLVSCANDD